MRLLIAGWQGQVAQSLITTAPSRSDIEACAVGRPALDICEVRTIERALSDIRPDLVINTAAYTDVDKAELEPDRAMALNCEGARLLAISSAQRNIPILHLSTDYVFGGTSQRPYVETDATAPATVYGKTKRAGEEAVIAANPKHIVLRTAWIYSAHGRNFVKSILQQARAGKPLRVVADQYGNPTYAPHLVDAILSIASRITNTGQNVTIPWGVYHAAGSGRASWYDIARAALANTPDVASAANFVEAISTADYPTKTPRPAHSELNCAKLDREFGLRLPAWTDGLADCVKQLSTAEAGG
ncbi:MAG TPA: dTDP-4-dehydrorhamnose reductase [Hyphomicrobium sp.]|nr:dTDP-4-dehydrorhamnose reductase [Hyphomicrobium sp.]